MRSWSANMSNGSLNRYCLTDPTPHISYCQGDRVDFADLAVNAAVCPMKRINEFETHFAVSQSCSGSIIQVPAHNSSRGALIQLSFIL
jgi:hypothetical protein